MVIEEVDDLDFAPVNKAHMGDVALGRVSSLV
jgi:hypothetical protein